MKIFLVLEWKISIYIFCMGYVIVTKGSKHKKKFTLKIPFSIKGIAFSKLIIHPYLKNMGLLLLSVTNINIHQLSF